MKMKFSLLVLLLISMMPATLPGQNRKPTTIAELVTYNAKDREQALYAGAKAEGKLTWYTSLAGESYKGMVKAFETKYPDVKVEAYRVSGSDMTTRMYEESKAKKIYRRRGGNHGRQFNVYARRFSFASLFLAEFCVLSGRR